MAAGPPQRSGGIPDSLFWGIFAAFPVLFGVVWSAAQLSALLSARRPAGIGAADTARALPRLVSHAGDPGAAWPAPNHVGSPVTFWASAVVVAAVVVAGVLAIVGWVVARRGRPGMAPRGELGGLRERAVLDRAEGLRPDLQGTASEVRLAGAGVALGRHGHHRGPTLWGTVEDSYAVVAPPRSGKTARAVIPTVLDHDGPAVVTSTRWDVVRITAASRAQRGPVWVFSADQSSHIELPAWVRPARWSPVAGCDDPQTAMVRARSLARASGAGEGLTSGEFWSVHSERVLRCYLHAAALANHSIGEVRRWADDPENKAPIAALRGSPAASAWAGELSSLARVADRQRDGVWGVVQQSLAALADPRLVESCTPADGEGFDPRALLEGGTLYVIGSADTPDVVAPLVAALVEAATTAARQRAAATPSGRLSPSLLMALDEVANIAPLPTLPTLLADGGGTGITTMIVLQSRAQARSRWGEDAAEAIIAACTHRLILGGGGELRELEDLSRLVGERDEETHSHSWAPWGGGQQGAGSSTQTSLRRIPIITPADLQAMPRGRGVLCSPATKPAEVWLPAWWERPDADELRMMGESFSIITGDGLEGDESDN